MADVSLLKKIYDSKSRSAKSHILTDEELTLVKDQAYERGLRDGRAATKQEIDAQAELRQKELEEALLCAMHKCVEEESENLKEVYNLVIKLGVSLFQKTFEASSTPLAQQEVESFISNHVASLHELPNLVVRVHSSQLNNVKKLCENISNKSQKSPQISVEEDPGLEPTDAIISWKKGYVARTLESLLAGVNELTFRLTPSDHQERTHHG